MFLLRSLVSIIGVFYSCSDHGDLRAYAPGDIVIGGFSLFTYKPREMDHQEKSAVLTNGASEDRLGQGKYAHNDENWRGCCTLNNLEMLYDIQMFLRSQVMIYAIQEINQRTPRVLPNLTLGYDIYDTCGDVSLAIRATLELLKGQSDSQDCSPPSNILLDLPEPKTKVLIGERYSEVSIAVARIATLASLAQISYASTSALLSKKFKFPTFFRTVSSDAFQTEGICKLVNEFNWKSVAIVGSDDEYGKYGSDYLEETFNKMNVCVEFVEILPGIFSQNDSNTQRKLEHLVDALNKSVAEAIIMFTKDTNVEIIMEAAIRHNLNRTWIASDTWSTSPRISAMPGIECAGQVFGFIFKKNEVPGFREYVGSMFNRTTNSILERHKNRFPLCLNQSKQDAGGNCSTECSDPCCLASCIDQDESYSIYLAVQVVAKALRSLLKCDELRCERGANFTVLELLKEIQEVNFTVNSTHLYFDDGDPRLGYDIVQWKTSTPTTQIETIGEYWPGKNITLPEDLSGRMKAVNVTAFNCSKTCEPGHMLKCQRTKCCFDCVPCADGEFSKENGEPCQRCGIRNHSHTSRDKCLVKKEEFLWWTDPFSIILSCFAGIAIIVTLMFVVVFTIHRRTPIVKAVGGYLSFLELFSLLFSFCLTFTFLGKPTDYSCAGIPLFGAAFSLCISCILANLLQILVGFNFDLKVGSWIKKLNQPVAVVIIISGLQLALTVSWLIKKPPSPHEEIGSSTVLHQCNLETDVFFIIMLAYNGALGVICFLFAIKGKQLPDLYKNAELISVSMVLFLIIWIVFLPVFVTLRGKYKPAISSAAILISSCSILCCHLAPKCYIMMFRKELNNEKAITEYIRKHYEQKGVSVVKS